MDNNDEQIKTAKREARNAMIMSWVWWIQVPLICVTYFFVSDAPLSERLMLIYLAAVSIIANAVSYKAVAKAAESKQAGYENP
jgi:hypothetical protein